MLGTYLDGDGILKTDLPELDVTDAVAVRKFVAAHRPELFLHLAASRTSISANGSRNWRSG